MPVNVALSPGCDGAVEFPAGPWKPGPVNELLDTAVLRYPLRRRCEESMRITNRPPKTTRAIHDPFPKYAMPCRYTMAVYGFLPDVGPRSTWRPSRGGIDSARSSIVDERVTDFAPSSEHPLGALQEGEIPSSSSGPSPSRGRNLCACLVPPSSPETTTPLHPAS